MVERWEKLVFLSPSKVQSVLDFKAQNSFSKRRVWWYSLRSFFPRQKESGQNHYTELFEYHLDRQAVFFFCGRCCQGPLNVCKSALTISEAWDRDRNWSLNKLSFVIPRIISDTIHATPKPFQSDLANLLTQNLSPNGQFNSNTAYALSKNSPTAPLAKLGNGFGKSPPSLESKLCQGKIPTKVLLNTRQIVQDATCLLCHFEVELSPYILRDCPLVPPIWAYHTDHTLPNDFDYSNTFGWFKKMATHKHPTPQSNIPWCVVFPVVLWSIWLVRNKLVMEEICFESNSILKRIASTSIDLFFILPTNWRNSPRTSHLLGWKPPPTGFFKLNIDDSA